MLTNRTPGLSASAGARRGGPICLSSTRRERTGAPGGFIVRGRGRLGHMGDCRDADS